MRFAIVVLLLTVVLGVSALEAQCAMCRTALEGSEKGQLLAQKFNNAILFLLGAPFGVATWFGIAMRRSRRRLPL